MNLLKYITASRYDAQWKGTAQAYILHWAQQVRTYHEMIPDMADRLSDNTLLAMLQSAVDGISLLQAIKTNMQLDHVKTGCTITYAQYCTLLLAAAASYDTTRLVNSKSRMINGLNLADEYEGLDDTPVELDGYTDIDTPLRTFIGLIWRQNHRLPENLPSVSLP